MRGTIRRQGTGSWQVRVYIDGKQKSFTIKGKKADAQKFLNELLHKLETGAFIEPTKMSLADYLTYWLENIKPTVRETTYASYSSTLSSHVIPTLGNILLAKLTPLHIQQLLTEKQKQGARADCKTGKLSSRTVRYILVVLKIALGQAVKWQLLTRNVAAAVEPPKQEKKEIIPWTTDQVMTFLNFTANDRLYALYLTAITTGLRRGEILGLRWQDIDFDEMTISVRQTVIMVNGKISISSAKTQKGHRTIAISPLLADVLRSQKRKLAEERLLYGQDYENNHLVFPYPDGRPFCPNVLTKTFKRSVKAAKLPTITLHSLRHTHASLLLAQGENPRLISERLGHASVSFTLQTYAHCMPGQQQEAARKLDKLLFPHTDNQSKL